MKFFRFYKNKRYYLSGKSEKSGKWYFLNKSHEENKDVYLDNERFAKGLEIADTLLSVKASADNVLIFKTAEEERKYCISKEELEQRKANKKVQSNSAFDFIKDIIKELFMENDDLIAGEHISKILNDTQVGNDGLVKADINEEDLPF